MTWDIIRGRTVTLKAEELCNYDVSMQMKQIVKSLTSNDNKKNTFFLKNILTLETSETKTKGACLVD